MCTLLYAVCAKHVLQLTHASAPAVHAGLDAYMVATSPMR
jgi:hypothetical protein